jgi:hypothetical protein
VTKQIPHQPGTHAPPESIPNVGVKRHWRALRRMAPPETFKSDPRSQKTMKLSACVHAHFRNHPLKNSDVQRFRQIVRHWPDIRTGEFDV